MRLPEQVKRAIEAEYDSWRDKLWAGKTKEERSKLGQFATPPPLTIKMLEKFDSLEGNVLDPCLGAGNLIAAAIIAGADPSKCYGIELDPVVHKVAQLRLSKLGVPPCNIVQGDALDPKSYEFDESPAPKTFAVLYQQDKTAIVLIVKNSKLFKEVKYNDKTKLKALVSKLLEKKIKVTKI